MYNLGFVEPIFWPSPVRIGLLPDFDDFHLAIGGWTSSGVDEGGDCRSEAVMTANRLVTSFNNKEEPTIIKRMYYHFVESYIVSILA